jgi:hypothetical protein
MLTLGKSVGMTGYGDCFILDGSVRELFERLALFQNLVATLTYRASRSAFKRAGGGDGVGHSYIGTESDYGFFLGVAAFAISLASALCRAGRLFCALPFGKGVNGMLTLKGT